MTKLVALAKREVILLAGVSVAAIEASVAKGASPHVAIQTALPIVLATFVRSLSTPTKEGSPMADLTALRQAAADLQAVASTVQSTVSALKGDAVPQADIDAVTAEVQQASDSLRTAVQ